VPPPPPVVVSDRNDEHIEYVVDRILDKRYRRGALEYLFKWKGYGVSENSWEPVANLTNCPALIAEFEAAYVKPINGRKKKARS
jgi:hypothetical protein